LFNPFKSKKTQDKKDPNSPASSNPVESPQQPGPAVPTAPEAVVTPLDSSSQGVLYRILSPETRTGRIMRPTLRWLAATFGLFALGLLVGYLVFYQPTQRELDTALSVIGQANQSVSQKDKNLQTAQLDREQAVKLLQEARDGLKKASSENELLVVMVGVSNVRVALVNKDGQIAKTTIEQTQSDLNKLLPYLEGQDKTKADVLKTRLDLAAKELVSDPAAAQADLDRLASDLSDLHKKLFNK
jgi:hypothetical protein